MLLYALFPNKKKSERTHVCVFVLMLYRDVQASSILLDDKFEVRLGSLSEVYAQGDAYQSRISRLLRLPQ